jgi:hypothetical protein
MRPRNAFLWLLAIFQLWLAHLLAYLMHEYAHSFVAWAMHAKSNPLALHYGGFNLDNLLFQDEIEENVDYAPIFMAGRGYITSIIAVSGVLVGNGVSYIASRLLYARAVRKNQRKWALFFFWTCLMSVGNFLSYVPLRTFATHADMATVAKGISMSPWLVCLFLGIPFAAALWHFFAKLLPEAEDFLFLHEPGLRTVLVLLSTSLVFVFFGSSGMNNYGPISRGLSEICRYLLFPLVTILCWQRNEATMQA